MSAGTLPPPGSVIRYAYLWADEHAVGAQDGRKDRPALVLAVSDRTETGHARVLVLAITHTAPRTETDAVALPASEKRRIGLDDLPSWIVTTEANAFLWPGPDIRPVPGRRPATMTYGVVAHSLLRRVAQSYLDNRQRQRAHLVPRTD